MCPGLSEGRGWFPLDPFQGNPPGGLSLARRPVRRVPRRAHPSSLPVPPLQPPYPARVRWLQFRAPAPLHQPLPITGASAPRYISRGLRAPEGRVIPKVRDYSMNRACHIRQDTGPSAELFTFTFRLSPPLPGTASFVTWHLSFDRYRMDLDRGTTPGPLAFLPSPATRSAPFFYGGQGPGPTRFSYVGGSAVH